MLVHLLAPVQLNPSTISILMTQTAQVRKAVFLGARAFDLQVVHSAKMPAFPRRQEPRKAAVPRSSRSDAEIRA